MQEASDLPILEVLSDYVKNRHLLLVLDNCEHLLEACSRLVDHLLRTSPGLTVLASSREALGIGGEAAYHVPSLTLPDLRQLSLPDAIAQSEAVSLFAERAALALAGFQVTPQNAPAVVKICRRLDGIPLAIELAAARAAALSIEQIAARLNDRFRLLTGGSRTALPRQQTLRASIDWSYSQLPEVERRLLNSLSVFAGGWSLEAAEQVCAGDGIEAEEMLDLLTSLVKKSLATFTAESGQEPRYHLLETIRQYAREKLLDYGGGEDLRRRHLIYFLALAEQAEAEFQGLLQREWMERLDTELENLRTALEWGLVDESPEAFLEGLRLILALCMVELTISADESSEWLEKYQAHPCGAEATPVELHAKTWSAFGILRFWQGNYPASRQAFSVSLALYRQLGDIQSQVYVLGYMSVAINFLADPAAQLGCVNEAISIAQQAGIYLQNLASLLRAKGFYYLHADLEIARRSYVECVALFEKRGDRLSAIAPLRFLGAIASAQGEAERAEGYLQKAVAASREMKSLRNLFYDLSASGDHAHRVGHYEQMEAFFREAQEVSEKIGLRNGTVWCLHHLGVAVRRQGQLQRAIHLTSKSLEYAREYDFAELVAECIASLAGLALDFGRLQESSRWMAAVEAQQGKLFVGPICELELQRDTAQVRALLGEEAFQAALLEGRALTLDQAVEEALAFCREADTG
jgi:non-specific serine/threonine protein kinase